MYKGYRFIIAYQKSYKSRTVEALRNKKKPSKKDVDRQSKMLINMHHARKIIIKKVNADNEFKNLAEELRPIPVNIVGADEHVGDIERSNRTVKDHTRCHVHRLSYKRYPSEMVCGCVIKSVKDLNEEVASNGISDVLSPGTLVIGRVEPSYKEVQALNFGDYVQAHVSASITNTNEPLTTGAIALYPSRNGQGSWYFMSLDTGKRIHRYSWDVIPLSRDVINRVNAIDLSEGQSLVATNFKYQWDPDREHIIDEVVINDDNDDDDNELPPPPNMLVIDDNGIDCRDEEDGETEELEAHDGLGAPDDAAAENVVGELEDAALENVAKNKTDC